MGEVYRARDTRLGRDVAVKILTAGLSQDPDALARFEREGRAVAALSHPNIVALYDVGREGPIVYVVTELLEGSTLRERLQSGAVPPRKALEYGRAIAEAVAAAHSRGIVHRDLKPDNVFITTDGRVKVLDFGIAHVEPPRNTNDDTAVTAEGGVSTAAGRVLGTIGYMAPEQVRGGQIDARTDVFALGALLYELLTGYAAFARGTPADTVTAILTADPEQLPRIGTSAGAATEQIVRRCLEKNASERFQSARDLSFALEAVAAGTDARPVAGGAGGAKPTRPLSIAAAALIGGVALVGAFLAGRGGATAPAVPGPRSIFTLAANPVFMDAASVSPDGLTIAYTGAADSEGGRASGVSLRRLDSTEVRPFSVTESSLPPFVWSPDSRMFAYFVNASLVVRELPSGPARTIAAFPGRATGIAWGPGGVILVGTAAGIYRVPAAGGTPELILKTDPAKEVWRSLPSFLPDGQRFLYTALHSTDTQAALETRVATLDGRDLGSILKGGVGTMYADGHLLFGTNGGLVAQPFDADRLATTGEPRTLAAAVEQNWRTGSLSARASDTGVVVYRTSPETSVQFTWVDRTGRRLGTVGAPDSYTNFDVSPDGRRIAATRRDPKTAVNSLVLVDALRGVTTPISPPDQDGFDDPTWHPDGRHLIYTHSDQLVMRVAEGGEERVILPAEAYADHVTRDGKFVTFGRQRAGLFEHWALDIVTPGAKPIVLAPNVTLSDETRFSKNEKWIAFHANESGTDQVWISRFPPSGEKWQISESGGVQPRWSADGNELFYLNPDGRLVAVAMPEGDPRRASEPRPLFLTGLTPSNALDQIAVVGDRFLLRLPAAGRSASSSPVHVLVNWRAR